MTELMWGKLAQYYDALYAWKDYRKEAARIHALIQRYKRTKGKALLDVGCGTGNHLPFLGKWYRLTGTDRNAAMLAVAKKKFPQVQFIRADMTKLQLRKKFDVITCLFGAIAYVRSTANLEKTIAGFAAHLHKGGVLVLEPFLRGKALRSRVPKALFINKPDLKIARMSVNKTRGNISTLDFHFLIATRDGVHYFHDPHHVAQFEPSGVLRLLKKHGFRARYYRRGLMKGRELYVGVLQ